MAKHPGGRPSKLTPEVQAELVKWIKAGNYIETAARLVGVSKRSVFTWLEKGDGQKRGRYAEFSRAVRGAMAEAEARLILLIDKSANTDWKAAAWRLERQYPDRWGRQTKHEVTGAGGGPIQHKGPTIYLPDNGRIRDGTDEVNSE